MKYLLIIFLGIVSCNVSFGQHIIDIIDTVEASITDTAILASEIQPEYPGGKKEMMKFINKNVNYPPLAIEKGIEGTVLVSFVVEKDGSLSNITIKRGLGHGCNEEVIRVVKTMPAWKPGEIRGKKVRTMMTLPVNFNLN